nr:basic 7S globulin-like [Tanacetum cinerariifolium]
MMVSLLLPLMLRVSLLHHLNHSPQMFLRSIAVPSNTTTKLSTIQPYTTLRTDIYNSVIARFSKVTKRIPPAEPVSPFGLCFKSFTNGTRVGLKVPNIDFSLQEGKKWSISTANSIKQGSDKTPPNMGFSLDGRIVASEPKGSSNTTVHVLIIKNLPWMLNLKMKERRREKRQRIQNRKKRKKKRTWLHFFVAKERKNTLVFIRNREEKQAIKPRFLMNPTTIMVDEGRIYAKTEDPHEDIGKLDGDKAMISRNDDQEMIKHMQQTNKSHEDLSGDGGTNPTGIWECKATITGVYYVVPGESLNDQESVNDVNNDDDTSDDDGEDELVDVRKKKVVPSTPIEDPFLTELCDSYDREKYVEKEVNSDEDINLEDDDVLEVMKTNPGSTVKLSVNAMPDGKNYSERFYVCFKGLKEGWLEGCRKVIELDECFLKTICKRELLSAVGRDGNNQIYPIAWEM